MEQFVVRKNTLPYVYQWAVLDTDDGNPVSEYKTKKIAEEACKTFNQYGLPDDVGTKQNVKDTWKAAYERMKRPGGDIPPKPSQKKPQYSNKRRVELN